MKPKLQLLSLCCALLFMVSCGSDDPKKNAEKAGECKCEYEELEAEDIKLRRDLIKTYYKNKRKVKNPEYDPEKSYSNEYNWEKEVNDWDEHASIQLDIFNIRMKQQDLEVEIIEYRQKGWEACDNQDDYDDWNDKFEKEYEDYTEENCKKLAERNRNNRDKLWEKERNYFEITDEVK